MDPTTNPPLRRSQLNGLVKNLLKHFKNDLPINDADSKKVLKKWGIKNEKHQTQIIAEAMTKIL